MTKREEQINAIGEYLASQPDYAASPADIRQNYPNLFHQDNNRPDIGQTLKPMIEAEWVVKTAKRRVELTKKGRRKFAQEIAEIQNASSTVANAKPTTVLPPVVHNAGSLDEVLAVIPPVQSAFIEMMACAIIARHHLGETRTTHHPAFMVVGETGSGKTVLAQILCRMFGFDEKMHIFLLGQKVVGELRGRRMNTPMGWMYQLPEEMTLPFVVFDEYDKATLQKRDAVLHYFQGDTLVRVETAYYRDRSVPMLVANPPKNGERYEMLRPEYRRRALILDTEFMRKRGAEVEEYIRNAYALTERAVIDLTHAKPTTERVTDAAVIVLQTVRELLTDDGQEEYPGTAFLETLVLGYCGLRQTHDTVQAAYRVGYAYLLCAETVEHAKPHAVVAWHERSDLTNAEAWSQTVKDAVKNRPREIAVRDEAAEYETELKWFALRDQWATHFEALADEVEDPPSDWDTRQNRKLYRSHANVLRNVARGCRDAGSRERLKVVITAGRRCEAEAQQFIDQWEEGEDEETEDEEDEVVEGEIVDERVDYSPSTSNVLALIANTRVKNDGESHLSRATTLRVKYNLYTYACEKCRENNQKVNGAHLAEQAYKVCVVWVNAERTSTDHLCYSCAYARYQEVEIGRQTNEVVRADFFPTFDTNPEKYMHQCGLCIHPNEAEKIYRYLGQVPWLKDLDGIPVCEDHRGEINKKVRATPCRYDPIT